MSLLARGLVSEADFFHKIVGLKRKHFSRHQRLVKIAGLQSATILNKEILAQALPFKFRKKFLAAFLWNSLKRLPLSVQRGLNQNKIQLSLCKIFFILIFEELYLLA